MTNRSVWTVSLSVRHGCLWLEELHSLYVILWHLRFPLRSICLSLKINYSNIWWENTLWAPGAGFVAKQLDPFILQYSRFVLILCAHGFHRDDFHFFFSQLSGVWLVSATCLGGCTHPVYPVSRVYFNHDPCAISPRVKGSSSEVDSTLMRIDSWTPLSVMCACVCSLVLHWPNDGLFRVSQRNCVCDCVCVCVRGAWKRYQRFSSQPHSCINIHQVMFQTESHSSLSTVQGTNKNRQKTTRSLLTMRTALGLTEDEAVRPSSDVYALIWRKCIFSVFASLLSCADEAFIRAKRLFVVLM